MIFPDEASRLVYRVSGSTITVAPGASAKIYTDAAGTNLLFTLVVDDQSRLPVFDVPGSGDTLYASVDNGPITPIYARTDDRLDALAADLAVVARAVSTLIGDGIATSFTFRHGRGTRDVMTAVRQTAAPEAYVFPTIEAGPDPLNEVVVRFNTPPALNQYRLVVMG